MEGGLSHWSHDIVATLNSTSQQRRVRAQCEFFFWKSQEKSFFSIHVKLYHSVILCLPPLRIKLLAFIRLCRQIMST